MRNLLLAAVATMGPLRCAAVVVGPTVGAWPAATASAALSGLRLRTGTKPLDLLNDLYDAETGLCGEGITCTPLA